MMNDAKGVINPVKRINMYKEIHKKIAGMQIFHGYLYHPQMGHISREGIIGAKQSPLGLIRYEDIIMEK